jgi:DedD protein
LASLAEDLNVDELRRRARRRLVGAIVLALAAAVVVPMLLESEPRPLGEDVAVKIPPVDDGKFVNRLNDPAGKSAPAAPKSAPPTPPTRSEPVAPKSEAPKSEAPKSDVAKDGAAPASAPITTAPPADAAPKADASAAPATSAPATSASATSASATSASATSAPAANPPAATVSKAPATPEKPPASNKVAPPADKISTNGGAKAEGAFAVQLAAFSDDKGANALAGKLKRAGYSAYTEPLKTSQGTLWRVRVGPYPSREAANAARDKLKSEGQNGIVAAAH